MLQFDDDVQAIFNSGDFDECAVFTIDDSTEICVNGIFTDATDATAVFGTEIEASKPTVVVPTSDIARVRNKMTVNIRDTDYTVEKVEKVGAGMSVVYLKT